MEIPVTQAALKFIEQQRAERQAQADEERRRTPRTDKPIFDGSRINKNGGGRVQYAK